MEIILANPRGFCAGVNRAIEIVERALDLFGAPIYVRHEVVHNKFVVTSLKEKGAVFVNELDEIPDQSTVIYSAHGVSQAVRLEGERRNLRVFDATCPLVTKVHMEVVRHQEAGLNCILIGHAGHPEVEGTMGQYRSEDRKSGMHLVESVEDVAELDLNERQPLAYVTQTTLSMDDTKVIVDALCDRFPNIIHPKKGDICYATQNRQDAVKVLVEMCDLVLVVGSLTSSNSNRLREIAEHHGIPAYLIDGAHEIQSRWLVGVTRIGVTAGASAPEILVEQVISRLQEEGVEHVRELQGKDENVVFTLPKSLK